VSDDLIRRLHAHAALAEAAGKPASAVLLRTVAQGMTELEARVRALEARGGDEEGETRPSACRGCGQPIRQPEGRGRPRLWCGRGRCVVEKTGEITLGPGGT
jgi:formamidopyrimidine-DNA glycosylase